LRRFDFEIKEGEWRTHNNWFVNYKGLVGRIKVRKGEKSLLASFWTRQRRPRRLVLEVVVGPLSEWSVRK
jgi:hypothetical protein